MGLKDFFKKRQKEELDPLRDLTLEHLKVGYLFDYDLKTWTVTAKHMYDWGEGDITYEWEIRSGDEIRFLEKEEDDEVIWKLMKKVGIHIIDPDGKIRKIIKENDDPPETITYEGNNFRLIESSAGYYYKNGEGPDKEFIVWDYEDSSGNLILSIEQWGEEDFEAAIGEYVEEYQFIRILPGSA